MSKLLIVIDDLKDWSPYYPSEDVITFSDYLSQPVRPRSDRVRIINLCRSYKYLAKGYYCSLLAEARGHHVIPSVNAINDLNQRALYILKMAGIDELLEKSMRQRVVGDESSIRITSYFGLCDQKEFSALTKALFERFPCPIIQVELKKKKTWEVSQLQIKALNSVKEDDAQSFFAAALNGFSSKLWRSGKARKTYRYDMAILVNPEEKLPPSDPRAIRNFVKAGHRLGIDIDLIEKRDFMRLPEYDGLLIRETTALDHHTYRFAKKAESEGMVVMDDPTSILRCTNKIYLHDLFTTNQVATPKTMLISRNDKATLESIVSTLGLPVVLKIPDGSFSRGVSKATTMEELATKSGEIFKQSALILAQEYLYTEFDWRIGILNNKPLYACKYFMAKDHWQIYNHGHTRFKTGGWETLPTYEAPKAVVDMALKASRLIGNGLYGVDLKQVDRRAVVIEVNDNPSIESGVEDQFLGDELYAQIMGEFLRRFELKRSA
jgi:glutathione synthase/RimK-type ligase-like ATP-grasp enzyme